MNYSLKKFLILFIWLLGFIFRIYRQNQLLGFYYDQGRDAQIASDIISFKNFPAIGPTTGINGLFLGPFWFYLITPGYFIARGNPAIASTFMAFLESLSIIFIFLLLKKYVNEKSAWIGAILWAFSYYLIRSSRWFSNPTPLPTFVLAMVFLLTEIYVNKKYKYWIWVTFLLGLTIQLEAASAVFFIPIILTFALINWHQTIKAKFSIWFKSALSFGILLVPQVGFEIKNNFLITKNFIGFLTGKVNSDSGKSWGIPTLSFFNKRILFFYNTFINKLDPNFTSPLNILYLLIFIIGIIFLYKKYKNNKFIQLNFLWLFIPLLFLIFFLGNYGNIYDYYLTGFFAAFIILFAVILSHTATPIVILFLATFLYYNTSHTIQTITANPDGPTHISLGNEMQGVNHICQNTKDKEYNLSVYVPPVIPHSYDYLFNWQIKNNQCQAQNTAPVDLIYTLHEVDPPHPERLEVWLDQQNNSSKIIEETKYGGVIVQKRQRIKNVK